MKTESEIVEELRCGSASAFDNLYKAYSYKLFNFAYSILKSSIDAEEVVQNTYYKIWERHQGLNSIHSFKSFLFTIAYNETIDRLRERLREKKYREIIIEKATSNYNLEESIHYGDILNQVEQIVKALPPRKHEIFYLSRVEHLSYTEIAERLNISVKTVENSLNFSLNFIKSRIGQDSLKILFYIALFL